MRKLSSSSFIFLSLVLIFLQTASHFPLAESRVQACDPVNNLTPSLVFCNARLGKLTRTKDLISRLTLKEKIGMLVNNAAAVPRLTIERYEWWSEALHGVSNVGPGTKFGNSVLRATSFPQVILTAASFNKSLFNAIGRVVSDEARAMYNLGQAGLSFWSPNINIFRDPRWGRGQETPGEDPHLSSIYAINYVRGLQNHKTHNLKIAACCKHFTAYDLDNWNGIDRFHFDAKVSLQDLKDTFNPSFEACVTQGRAASVMCSYNKLNGIPTCADGNLLRKTLRDQWGLDGYVVSDCNSVDVIYKTDHYTSTPEQAAAKTMEAGLDLECGEFLAQHAEEAVRIGLLNVSHIDRALTNTILVQMRLGMFDGDSSNNFYGKLGYNDICSSRNQELAIEAARQGIVLLKNQKHVLPLPPIGSLAVVGPNIDVAVTMIGNYAGIPCRYTTPLEGFKNYVARVAHVSGCNGVTCVGSENFHLAEKVARNTDATVIVAGLDQSIEMEGRDRTSLLLPGKQMTLITRVAAAANGPVILVIMSGGPVDVTFAKHNPRIGAILWAGYPGEAGGMAIADVIFEKNPGGKLPMTWYPESYLRNVAMTDMQMRANPATGFPGRTYRYYTGKAVYKFGYGLSYTSFSHAMVEAPSTVTLPLSLVSNNSDNYRLDRVPVSKVKCGGLLMRFHVDVTNSGKVYGEETVMVFVKRAEGLRLVKFKKVAVPPAGLVRVKMSVDVCRSLSTVDEVGESWLKIATHDLRIGYLSHNLSLQTTALGGVKP